MTANEHKFPYMENTSSLYPPCSIDDLRCLIEFRRKYALEKMPQQQLIHLAFRTSDVQRVLDGLELLEKAEASEPTTTTPRMLDITAPRAVEVQIRSDAQVIWVNIDGVCALRAYRIGHLIVVDDRRPKANVVVAPVKEVSEEKCPDCGGPIWYEFGGDRFPTVCAEGPCGREPEKP